MKAWEIEKSVTESQIPARLEDDNESVWEEQSLVPEKYLDSAIKIYWGSRVPGSLAKETLVVSMIQATENMGRIVHDYESLLLEGFRAITEDDMLCLHKATYKIFAACNNAEIDKSSPYWDFTQYENYEQYKNAIKPVQKLMKVDFESDKILDKLYASWLAQIIGGAYGTCLEGYTSSNIDRAYNNLDCYIRKPNTYNDDITYELALLAAFERCGKETSSNDIASEWISRISVGWSAEDMAMRNLRCGLVPPESGRFNNPFREWIGAQMRGAICGQLYPCQPEKAAELAWKDGQISHIGNGILGEIFNAVLVSLAFSYDVCNEKTVYELLETAFSYIPDDSQYYSVVKFALDTCKNSKTWQEAWAINEKKLEKYNWIHAYPNAAIEVISLWFGKGDFDTTLQICGRCGKDVDCNAAQILSILGAVIGVDAIPSKWKEPIGDTLDSYVRGMKTLSIKSLARRCLNIAKLLYK